MTDPLCTCGKRPKHKCCEENEHKSGKMCLKEYEAVRIPNELLERIKVIRQKAEENKLKEDIYSEGGYTSCGACCGYGCNSCMPQMFEG